MTHWLSSSFQHGGQSNSYYEINTIREKWILCVLLIEKQISRHEWKNKNLILKMIK